MELDEVTVSTGYYKVDKPDPFMGAERPDRSACVSMGAATVLMAQVKIYPEM